MRVSAGDNGPGQQEGTAAAQHFVHVAMIVSLSVLAVACAYFGALYLITH
jgi:hypothetical protein